MNGTHTGAFELARRFRLRVARMSSVSAEVEYQARAAAAPAVGTSSSTISTWSPAPARARRRRTRGNARLDRRLRSRRADRRGRVAHGSPAPGRPPQPPQRAAVRAGTDNFDLEFEPSPSQSTRQMSPEDVEALDQLRDDVDDPVIVDRPPSWVDSRRAGRCGRAIGAARGRRSPARRRALGDDIDSEVAAELGSVDRRRSAVRSRRGARVRSRGRGEHAEVGDRRDLRHRLRRDGAAVAPGRARAAWTWRSTTRSAISGSYDPYGTEAVQTPPFDRRPSRTRSTTGSTRISAKPPRAESHRRGRSRRGRLLRRPGHVRRGDGRAARRCSLATRTTG